MCTACFSLQNISVIYYKEKGIIMWMFIMRSSQYFSVCIRRLSANEKLKYHENRRHVDKFYPLLRDSSFFAAIYVSLTSIYGRTILILSGYPDWSNESPSRVTYSSDDVYPHGIAMSLLY